MGFGSELQTTTVNPNAPQTQAVGGAASNFLQQLFADPTGAGNPFAALMNPGQGTALTGQAGNAITSFLGQQAPEMQAFSQAMPALMGLIGQGGAGQGGGMGRAGLEGAQFQPMAESGRGAGGMNSGGIFNQGIGSAGFNAGQRTIEAATPGFQQNLAFAQGQLGNQAQNRFGTAFQQQGIDLNSRALQDFNLFQQQALQQGLGQDIAAFGAQTGRGQAMQQGILGGAGLLGQLAGQAGQNPFQRALGAGQFGMGLNQQMIDPTMGLLLGGMNFGRQAPMETIARESGGGFGSLLGGLAGAFGGSFLGGMGGNLADRIIR